MACSGTAKFYDFFSSWILQSLPPSKQLSSASQTFCFSYVIVYSHLPLYFSVLNHLVFSIIKLRANFKIKLNYVLRPLTWNL
jgi:hypothetical protein